MQLVVQVGEALQGFWYLFRSRPEEIQFAFTWKHALMTLVFVLGYVGLILWMRRMRSARDWKILHGIERLSYVLLALVVVGLYSWYAWHHIHKDSLPFYHCRFSMIILLAFAFWNALRKRRSMHFLLQWAVAMATFGGWLAMLMPDPDPFRFPHVTNFTYGVGHFVLGYIALILLRLWDEKPGFRNLLKAQVFLLVYNCFLIGFDYWYKENYGYFRSLPFYTEMGERLGWWRLPLTLLSYAFLLTVFWVLNRWIWGLLHPHSHSSLSVEQEEDCCSIRS